MKFRLKAFGAHLLCSAIALSTLVLGALYLGWYHWPGWHLTEATHVVVVMVGVDVVVGPLITLIIANARKPRRELARDIAIIVAVQLVALGYGATTLWNGRPLYYAFSVNCLQVVQASDIDPEAARAAREKNLPLAPHWYSLPRWIWAPFPKDSAEADKIFQNADARRLRHRRISAVLQDLAGGGPGASHPAAEGERHQVLLREGRRRCSRSACRRPDLPPTRPTA